MAERKVFYFKQPVAYAELNAAFDGIENAINDVIVDYGLAGIAKGLAVAQHLTGNLTVDVTSGVAYDPQGERIAVPVTQNVNAAVDYLSTSTAVTGAGHSKILSLFAQFERSLSDPRTDGNLTTVYFEHAESFALNIIQGTEGASPSPPALQASQILLADITIVFGQTAIHTGDISFARTQYSPNPGSPAAASVSCPAETGTRFSLIATNLAADLAAIQTAIDGMQSNGADTIKQYASVTAMRAGGAPSYATAAVATIPSFGLYVWSAASTATDDGLFVVKPTSVSGAGRWLSMTSQISATPGALAGGLPVLDGTGRLAATFPRNGVFGLQRFRDSSGTGSTFANTTSSSFVTASTATITFANALAGDFLVAACSFIGFTDAGGTAKYQLGVNDGGVVERPESLQTTVSASLVGMCCVASHTVQTAGPASFTCSLHMANDGSHNAYVVGAVSLIGVLFRP